MHYTIHVRNNKHNLPSKPVNSMFLFQCHVQCRSRPTCWSTGVHSRVTRKPHACDASLLTCEFSRARVTSARSTRERVSIASIPRPLPPRKKVEGLGTRLACPLRMNLVHAFERERMRVRVLACTCASTCVCVCEYSCVHVCACPSTRVRLARDT